MGYKMSWYQIIYVGLSRHVVMTLTSHKGF